MVDDIFLRKIQLVGNSSYAVSLPKDWVLANKLKEKDTVALRKTASNNLIIDVNGTTENESKSVKICVDKIQAHIRSLLYSLYYQGYEEIEIYTSKGELSKQTRVDVRKIMTHMSGTVIEFESNQKIILHVLLNEAKVNLVQMLYRICMVIDLQFDNLADSYNHTEVSINENEINRVYHLLTKTISLLLTKPSLLKTSGISKMSLLPSYIILARKLENLGDELKSFSGYLFKNKDKISEFSDELKDFQKKFLRIVKPVTSVKKRDVEKEGISEVISKSDKCKLRLRPILDLLWDIEIESQIIYLSK